MRKNELKTNGNEFLGQRLNNIEYKMDILFDQIIDIKTNLRKDMIRERIDETKQKKQKYEEELKYLEMDLDTIWQENERLQKQYRNINYGDCEPTMEIRG